MKEILPTYQEKNVPIEVYKVDKPLLDQISLNQLCEAAESALLNANNFFSIGMLNPHQNNFHHIEKYFKGVMLIDERTLFIVKFDGIIAGSIQLVTPAPANNLTNFACIIDNHFVTAWARGYGLAKNLLIAAEEEATASGYTLLKLSVRGNNEVAIALYESLGYKKWGILNKNEKIDGTYHSGHFYYKEL